LDEMTRLKKLVEGEEIQNKDRLFIAE